MRTFKTALVLFHAGLAAAGAWAQTNDDVNSGVQFNFSTPGARSLAMGGAFLGLADDATAAYTNPAGLTNLTLGGSEVSIEFRGWQYSNVFPETGHAFGSPTGVGLDTLQGVRNGEIESQTSGLSFLSLGYVLPKGWTLAVYRHELANFKAFLETQGPFVGAGDRRGPDRPRRVNRIFPIRSNMDLQILNTGVSTAYDVVRSSGLGSFSIGLGVSYYECQLSSRTDRFYRFNEDRDEDGDVQDDDDALNRQPGGFYGPADFLGDNIFNTQTQQGDDSDLGINVGVLWKIGRSGRWSLGAAYRQGPEFATEAHYIWGPAAERYNQDHPRAGTVRTDLGGPGVLHVPDTQGVGVAWSSREGNIKLTLDYDRVRYSQLIENLTNILGNEEDVFNRASYRLEDADEVHLGLEYVFLVFESQLVGTVRAGAWYDPAHVIEYVGTEGQRDTRLLARFPPGEDDTHLSFGLGFVIRENFQIDVALDSSDRTDTASVSIVKFF